MDGAVWRMVRHLNKLTALKAESLTEPGRHSDGGGLYLKVSKTGGRAWIFMYTHAGRQREMGLGPAGQGGVTLAKARKAATAARDALAEGVDPLTARKDKAAMEQRETTTFGGFADMRRMLSSRGRPIR